MTTFMIICIYAITIVTLEFYRRDLLEEFRYYLASHRRYRYKFRIRNNCKSYYKSNIYKTLQAYTKQNILLISLVVAVEILQAYILLLELLNLFN